MHIRHGAFAVGFVVGAVVPASPAGASFAHFQPDPAGGAAPATEEIRLTPTPSLEAYQLADDERIEIDGRLDDAGWVRAMAGQGFRMWDPDRGKPPTQETVFKIAYDRDAIYVAIACHEADPADIAQSLSRRDRHNNSDYVSVFIDPYHDRTTGYNFRVNPLGVQQDRYVYNDGDTDTDWDAVWEAETFQDGDGWYSEMRIPFSSIRYRASNDTWGLQVRRYMHQRGEESAWTTWDRDTPGYVSRFGTLTGLRDVPAPRQLEIVPYFVGRATDPSVTGPEEMDGFENFGVDVNYGITADMKLNATFQPDFGQVEADPSELNLSPFETFFEEKRPFFIEGSRFFQHQDFNLFYSRRIGTGDERSRIRYAGKLTGKTVGGISVAALVASTDLTADGQTHNFLRNGSRSSQYIVGRFGKEFSGGKHRVNVTQTAVVNSASRDDVGDRASREAYTSGLDFRTQFADRTYTIEGSVVGSVIDPEGLAGDPGFQPSKRYGTGGEFSFHRSGNVSTGTWFRWESDRLDLNDIGFLGAPDEMNMGGWASYNYNPEGKSTWLNRTNVNLNLFKSWLYGDRTGFDFETGAPIWRYSRGHRAFANGNVNGWTQFKNYAEAWWGLQYNWEGTQRFDTRSRALVAVRDSLGNAILDTDGDVDDYDVKAIPGGGPLISEPATYGAWWGALTDSRKDVVVRLEGSYFRDTARNHSTSVEVAADWNQSSSISHEIQIEFDNRVDDTQHLDNFENPGGGIGGVSYVYGKIHQRTLELTLRTSLLFSRSQSLEIYAQPFITVGDYTDARELVRPDSYDLRSFTTLPFSGKAYDVSDNDFSFSAVNLNAVYRWEYRPGSAIFLVWTHSRSSYTQADFFDDRTRFDNGLKGDALFENEPENVFLAKITYWLPI